MKHSAVGWGLAVLIGIPSPSPWPQEAHSLRPDARIRVSTIAYQVPVGEVLQRDAETVTFVDEHDRTVTLAAEGQQLVGHLHRIDDETLTLMLDGPGGTVQVPRDAITKIEVSQGKSRTKGALIGAGVGAVVGLVVVNSADDSCEGFVECYTGAWERLGSVVLSVLMVPLGAGLGALASGERWRPINSDGLHVALTPTRGGGVRAQVSFGF